MLNLWGKREEKPKNEHKSGRKGCESVDENHETNNKQSTETPANTRKYRFIGSFSHGLDAKGRLVIPQPFREKLGEEFYIAPSFDFKSIAIYPNDKWEERSAELESRNKMSPELNIVKNFFYALSYDGQTCDGQGRVLLPANIRQKILGEERDVERPYPDQRRGCQRRQLDAVPEQPARHAGKNRRAREFGRKGINPGKGLLYQIVTE